MPTERELDQLTQTQRQILDRIILSFKTGVEVVVNSESDLCSSPEFSDYFANLFCVYHSITEHKFEKKSFEFAFKHACLASGIESEINRNSSHQGEDVTRGEQKISLKTEGEKSRSSFKISKFSEARFIADYKTEREEEEIKSLTSNEAEKKRLQSALETKREELLPLLVTRFQETVEHHLSSYDRIIGLKANAIEDDGKVIKYNYRLLEIPVELIRRSLRLTAEDFKALKGNGGTSASVSVNGKKAFGITLDGSVEKISLTGIQISSCFVHAEFTIPVQV